MTWYLGQLVAGLIKEKNLTKLQSVLKATSVKERQSLISEKINRSSLLYIAIKYKLVETVKFFLECGANANDIGYEDGIHYTCLAKAAEVNDLESVEALLQHGADIDGVTPLKTTALFLASSQGNIDIVRCLWCNGADINRTNYEGNTCLMASIAYPTLCRYLIGVGARVNAVNALGNSALVFAIKAKQAETVSILLDAGANPFFVTPYGLNAAFLVTYMELHNCRSYFKSAYEHSKNCISIAFEILSCEKMVKGEDKLSCAYWKKAIYSYDPLKKQQIMHRCPDSFQTDLQPISDLLSEVDVNAITFCEFRFGLQHPFTLNLLKIAVLKIASVYNYMILFNFFIRVTKSSKNLLFLEIADHVRDMLDHFCQKYKNVIRQTTSVLENLANYLEDSQNRLDSMDAALKLANLGQIDLCHKMILDYVSAFIKKCPALAEEIEKHVSKIIKINARGKKNSSLLHFCIKQNYNDEIAKLLMDFGADINAIDDDGKKPVFYTLMSSECSTREMIDFFLKRNLQFDGGMEDDSCLSCLLNENDFLKNSTKYTTLQCLAAKATAKNNYSYTYNMPRTLQIMSHSHSNLCTLY